MPRRGATTDAQRALFALLKGARGKVIEEAQILSATGWKRATWRSYLGKGMLLPYLQKEKPGQFRVVMRTDADEAAFLRQVSQTVGRRDLGACLRSPLARSLVKKARDNMTLALELYNRPSLENRLDAFSMLFCTAWEQLLKAETIEADGEQAIYRATRTGKRQETINLEEAVDKRIGTNGAVRENLLTIAELRHGATHLLMPETQTVLSRLFQAGVLNFSRRYTAFVGAPLFGSQSAGLLSLVSDGAVADAVSLKQLYGDAAGQEIADLIGKLEAAVEQNRDEQFAVSVEYKLVLTKRDTEGDIRLTTSPDAATTALVVEKPVPIEQRYQLTLGELAKQLGARLNRPINEYDAQSLMFKKGWKSSDNAFHHHQKRLNMHWYSSKVVDALAEQLTSEPDYLKWARDAYAAHLKKSKLSPTTR